MSKHRKLILYLSPFVVLVIVLALHFVPFDSRTGYLDKGLGNVCVGYTLPVTYNYRWVTGGVNEWDNQLSYLKESKITPGSHGCTQPAHLRLYLL